MYTVYYTIVYCGILYTVYCIFNIHVVVYGIGADVHCIICLFDSLITQASISLGTVEPQFYFAVAQQPDIPNIPKLNELMTVSRNITLHTIDNTVAVDRLGSQQSGVSVPVQFPNQHGFACSPSDTNAVCACVSVCEKLEPLSPDLSFLSGLLENQLIGFLVLPPRLLLVLVRVKPWPTAVQQVLPTLVDMREE